MNENEAREGICRVGRSLFDRGYVHATAGNISVKLDAAKGGGFLITPTDACLGNLSADRLARLDEHGVQLSGDRASKTILMHQQIYAAAAATSTPAHCIIHTHSTYCVAITLRSHAGTDKELLPPLTPYFVMKVGHVPWIPYARPGDPSAANMVASTITARAKANVPIRAVMLDRLGPNVWGSTPASAMATLEELEETAKLYVLSGLSAQPLTPAQIADLRTTFGAHW